MMWSRIAGEEGYITYPNQWAKKRYTENDLEYHNWDHIMSCYKYLEDNNVPHHYGLDYAVLFHDIVYDDQAEKESRSADVALRFLEPDFQNVRNIIMATEKHAITEETTPEEKWMIKADLHGLAHIPTAIENYPKVMKEACRLYGIDEVKFAWKSKEFMVSLAGTMFNNFLVDSDKFWHDVVEGIDTSITISNVIIQYGDRLNEKTS